MHVVGSTKAGQKLSEVIALHASSEIMSLRKVIPFAPMIKQVASGRFGVTTEYLVNAEPNSDQDGGKSLVRVVS